MASARVKILVTGGAGFIGSHVAEAALSAGHEVAVLDDLSTGKVENIPDACRHFRVDLRDSADVEGALEDFRPDWVSHQAAQASVSVSMREPKRDVMVNVVGSLNLLDACAEVGVQRFVFASTGGAIYGEVPEPQRADESWPGRPLSPYAISKLAVEQLLDVYRSERGLSSVVLRYANVYGPRQDPHGEAGVVAIFMQRLLEGKPLQINGRVAAGDAGCVRDYVFVADVVRANLAALSGDLQERVVNVGTGVETTTRDLARQIAGIAGIDTGFVAAPPRAGDLQRSVLDPTRAGLAELVPIDAGLIRTWQWYRNTRAH
jgi:UDP-glucose 4-epimerase